MKTFLSAMILAMFPGSVAYTKAAAVVESERTIPICDQVDVVVVGGTCGAVAAAEAAARTGAKVFLAAPRPYLGDDIAGTLRLWLEPGETPESPLAKTIYSTADRSLAFSYTTDVPSGGKHKDSGDMLSDGRHDDVQHNSVEFANDVTITMALEGERPVETVELVGYRRANDFEIVSVVISASADGKTWGDGVECSAMEEGSGVMRYSGRLDRPAGWLRAVVKKANGAKRILIGECIVMGPGGQTPMTSAPTPLRVKQVLDKALLTAGVAFLTSSYVTDVLRDAGGQPAGVVIANRSGRQAVPAKIVIDATERGVATRLAGGKFLPYGAGQHAFTRVVIAGDPPAAAADTVIRTLPGVIEAPITSSARKDAASKIITGRTYACEMQIPMKDGSFSSFAEAEQIARDRTFVKSLLDAGDTLFQVPPDPVIGMASSDEVGLDCAAIDLGCFRPRGVQRVYILGGCAAISRKAAAKLLRPLALMGMGERIGIAAAQDAKGLPAPSGVTRLSDAPPEKLLAGEVKEVLVGPRPFLKGLPGIRSGRSALPVLGEYDVVVVGGGTGGAPAGIAAGRRGAKTLLIEHLYGLGGVGTLGMIGKYWYGMVCGFTAEHDQGVAELGAKVHIVGKNEWWRRENRKAGTEIWLGSLGCGAWMEGSRVRGVVVATPLGRGVVLAKSVIDATGNADLALSAGAPCVFQGADELALQGVGLSPRRLGASYINSDFGYVNDSDAADLWLFGVRGRAGAGKVWDISQLVESRERQRIIGDCWVTPLDIVNGRTFPDTIVQARSNFDSHGYSIAEICYVSEAKKDRMHSANVPYRALLPKGIDGLAVIGLGISAHRDAMPIMRMQPDIQNMGYAAGVAASMASGERKTFRDIDVKGLQRHLVEKGNLPAEVLGWEDNGMVDIERLESAVNGLGKQYRDVGLVLAQWEQALPQMRKAHAAAERFEERLVYAHVLGIMGDPAGVEELVAVVTGKEPGLAMDIKGENAFGRRMSQADSYIVALGRTRDSRALKPLLGVLAEMDGAATFTRYRALTLALEALGDPAAARPLAELLGRPGISGHAFTQASGITAAGGYGGAGGNERSLCLRELAIARALYRCGDYEGVAEKILRDYSRDLRGVYALHATEVLRKRCGD